MELYRGQMEKLQEIFLLRPAAQFSTVNCGAFQKRKCFGIDFRNCIFFIHFPVTIKLLIYEPAFSQQTWKRQGLCYKHLSLIWSSCHNGLLCFADNICKLLELINLLFVSNVMAQIFHHHCHLYLARQCPHSKYRASPKKNFRATICGNKGLFLGHPA